MNIKELMVRLDELYTKKNTELLNYIKHNKPEEYDWEGNTKKHFKGWFCSLSEDNQNYISKKLMIEVDDLCYGLHVPPPWYEMISYDYVQEFINYCTNIGERPFPAISANDVFKTSSAISLTSNTLLPRTTWLVHFTDYPKNITRTGFTKGIPDKEKLAATTMLDDSEKMYGGYNFAFLAYSTEASKSGKKSDMNYGEHLLFFQSSGVRCWHKYDSEEQIIFWGEDVPPNTIVPVYRNINNIFEIRNYINDTIIFETKDYSILRKWIEKNYHQYKRVICNNA